MHLTGKRRPPTKRNITELICSRGNRCAWLAKPRRQPAEVWVQAAILAINGNTGDMIITDDP